MGEKARLESALVDAVNTTKGAQRALGPIKLSPGVEPKQIGIFLIVICCTICALTFMPLMQPFVFT